MNAFNKSTIVRLENNYFYPSNIALDTTAASKLTVTEFHEPKNRTYAII